LAQIEVTMRTEERSLLQHDASCGIRTLPTRANCLGRGLGVVPSIILRIIIPFVVLVILVANPFIINVIIIVSANQGHGSRCGCGFHLLLLSLRRSLTVLGTLAIVLVLG